MTYHASSYLYLLPLDVRSLVKKCCLHEVNQRLYEVDREMATTPSQPTYICVDSYMSRIKKHSSTHAKWVAATDEEDKLYAALGV
jgi:hypothetical protein